MSYGYPRADGKSKFEWNPWYLLNLTLSLPNIYICLVLRSSPIHCFTITDLTTIYRSFSYQFPERFSQLLLRRARTDRAARLCPLPPRHPALPEGYQRHLGMYHQHQQCAFRVRRRGRSADAAAEVDAVLRFCHVDIVSGIVFGVRPGVVRRQVSFVTVLYGY